MQITKLTPMDFPAVLAPLLEIPEPPKALYVAGTLPADETTLIAIIGSRKHTPYGKEVCEHLIRGLRGFDIAIVSGLALGIDSIAHRAALDTGLPTIAVPGSGLSKETLYPREHVHLAEEIVMKGGALLSEYEPEFKATTWSFPRRNRIMAGLSKAVLIIEAERPSGTLITARLATEYGRDVMAVPGSIFSSASAGAHFLLQQGAAPITEADDILRALGFEPKKDEKILAREAENASDDERTILAALTAPLGREELMLAAGLPLEALIPALSVLEIKGLIVEEMGKIRRS